ncbi:hypothetical protein [Kineococcus auxinigenes]|uniref:hypothetical protein n=1 Tax=unclassified Kineococcus TaxID=2621656 RepID=UPI003D7DB44F
MHRGNRYLVRQAGDVGSRDARRQAGLPSRSAAVQRAVRALTHQQLEQDCAAAWRDWDDSVDRLGPAPRRLPFEALNALGDALRLHLAL